MEYTSSYQSPIGTIILAGAGDALTGLWFHGQKYFGATLSSEHKEADLPVFSETRRWLDVYFQGQQPDFTPPLAPKGSDFRQAVWDMLLQIPYGQTVTYGTLAKKLAQQMGLASMSAQAVGGAVGHNPVSLIIPCHRVLGAKGALIGYAGGVEKKAFLLELERSKI